MRIAVRLDDIAPAMNWPNFERMIKLLDGSGAKPLLGVIPDCRDEKITKMEGVTTVTEAEFTERINALISDGAVIAMHGARHVYTTEEGGLFPLNRKSEFAGLGLEEQEALLKEGRDKMKELGLETDIFMAPAHSYDKNTLSALKSTGFKRVTDGFGTGPYMTDGLTWFPIAVSKKQAAKSRIKSGSVTVVYHTNTMEDKDFTEAEAFFKSVELIPFKELLFSPTARRPELGQRLDGLAARGKRFLAERRGGRRGR